MVGPRATRAVRYGRPPGLHSGLWWVPAERTVRHRRPSGCTRMGEMQLNEQGTTSPPPCGRGGGSAKSYCVWGKDDASAGVGRVSSFSRGGERKRKTDPFHSLPSGIPPKRHIKEKGIFREKNTPAKPTPSTIFWMVRLHDDRRDRLVRFVSSPWFTLLFLFPSLRLQREYASFS